MALSRCWGLDSPIASGQLGFSRSQPSAGKKVEFIDTYHEFLSLSFQICGRNLCCLLHHDSAKSFGKCSWGRLVEFACKAISKGKIGMKVKIRNHRKSVIPLGLAGPISQPKLCSALLAVHEKKHHKSYHLAEI